MWELLRRFSALDHPAKSLFVRAWVTLFVISLSLRLRGFRSTQAMLERRIPSPFKTVHPETVMMTVRMVKAAVRHSFAQRTCLEESLTLWWMLGRQGVPAEVRIGVQKSGDRFTAHAWVESNGVALNEPESVHQHYAAFEAELGASLSVMR
jgi:hypothetical protein